MRGLVLFYFLFPCFGHAGCVRYFGLFVQPPMVMAIPCADVAHASSVSFNPKTRQHRRQHEWIG